MEETTVLNFSDTTVLTDITTTTTTINFMQVPLSQLSDNQLATGIQVALLVVIVLVLAFNHFVK